MESARSPIDGTSMPQTSADAPVEQQYTQVTNQRNAANFNRRIFVEKVEQLIIFFYFFMAALLSFRFVLSLFGANRTTPFVNFVHQLTTPFMFPFEGMFGAPPQLGEYRLEFEVLVALLVYAIILFGLSRLVRIVFN